MSYNAYVCVEGCESGLFGSPGKRRTSKGVRGFESLSLRHESIYNTNMRATAVIIQFENKILLAKRSPNLSEEPEKWENVGGSVDDGESFEEAAVREIKEELGVELEILGTALEYRNETEEITCKVLYGRINKEPKIMERDSCMELKWFLLEDLKDVDLAKFARGDFIRLGYIS